MRIQLRNVISLLLCLGLCLSLAQAARAEDRPDEEVRVEWGVRIVSFETNGGSAVPAQSLETGAKAVRPEDPVRAGYSLAGWFTDKALKTAYDFSKPVKNDLTLYAKWTATGRYTLSLSLTDSFEINLYVRGLEDYDACTIRYGDVSGKVSEGQALSDGSGYRFLLGRCAAKEMADDIHVTVTHSDGTVLHDRDYSIRAYCLAVLQNTAYQELWELCQAVLDYGSYAQSFFQYNTENPANAGTNPFPLLTIPERYRAKDAGACTGILSIAATLTLESQTMLTAYITPVRGYTLDQFAISVKDDSGSSVPFTGGELSDGRFYASISGIAGKELDAPFTVTIKNRADGTALSKTMSALSYGYAAQSALISGLTELCQALYRYNLTAAAYFQR